MKKSILLTTILILLLFLSSCQPDTEPDFDADRPYSPWVFRSVLDLQPRMLTMALSDNLWAAYHADNGALYKVWKGNVEFSGAVYDTQHGPQPVSLGNGYFVNEYKKPWVVKQGGKEVQPDVKYRGHKMVRGQVELMYDLMLENGKSIRINERPEYIASESGLHGFERIFTTTDVPNDVEVLLNTNVSSVSSASQVQTDSEFKVINESPRTVGTINAVDLKGQLKLKSNASTRLATFFVNEPLIENPNKKEGESEEELQQPLGQRLINKSDCKTCHNPTRKTIGPSYLQIASKYNSSDENVAMLANKIIKGGGGVWGQVLMSAHPNVSESNAKQMVSYILSLATEGKATVSITETNTADGEYLAAQNINASTLLPGLMMQVHQHKNISKLADINPNEKPVMAGVTPKLKYMDADMGGLESNFSFIFEGYLEVPEDGVYNFHLSSDDGSQLIIDGKQIIDHDGYHGTESKYGDVGLQKGQHNIYVDFFQGGGGKNILVQWRKKGETTFEDIEMGSLSHTQAAQEKLSGYSLPIASGQKVPGDAFPLNSIHPSYDLSQARPDEFLPKVGGMDFLADGRLVVSTWDEAGAVYIIDGAQTGDPAKMSTKKIAEGLAEPLGLKVVDGDIYILQKQELTRLKDTNGDDVIDEYQTVSNDWKVSANFHEFAFGLVYKEGYFYGTLATGIMPGGASMNPQMPDRGKVVKISKDKGTVEFVASGLRTPNGIGIGTDGELYVADNQGDWLPSSKIVHVRKDAWFGSRSVDFEGTANLKEAKPVVWLPQDEIGNSPSTPIALNDGPYKGQMIHGEVTHGGVKRVFVEKVNGEYQGAVFRFMQGIEGGVNRLIWGPDGGLYMGCIGSTGNWQQSGKLWYGIQRAMYNNTSTFEMLAIRAKANGVEIEFTEPLKHGQGWLAENYEVRQWQYVPTKEYGGPKVGDAPLKILSVNVSEDRKKVFLELNGLAEDRVVYVHLLEPFVSEMNHELWTTEGWYTMNAIPKNAMGTKTTPPILAINKLTDAEKAAGWELLFDGKTTNGWRNFKKQTVGSGWVVKDGTLMLNSKLTPDGKWQATDGGDIITDKAYENFELNLEWKINNCGNSGILFNVVEDDKHDHVWVTGPEMQILDNTCHPDTKYPTHRAGDLYDMIECKYVTVKPAGEWNKVRLITNQGKVEHWLNGRKVLEYQMHNDKWKAMIANSKFKDMPDFGLAKRGHISLQDHSDKVWFRNIKIKEL